MVLRRWNHLDSDGAGEDRRAPPRPTRRRNPSEYDPPVPPAKNHANNDEMWRNLLTGTDPGLVKFQNFMKRLPHGPRCKLCNAPFAGVGRVWVRAGDFRVQSSATAGFGADRFKEPAAS